MVNDQEAGDHENNEPNRSAVERGDNDSKAESSSEMHRDDHEQGLLSNNLNVIPILLYGGKLLRKKTFTNFMIYSHP